MNKIYAFNNGGRPNFMQAMAIAESGHVVGTHICSSEGYMRSDIGVTSTWHHEDYKAHYPDGFEVEWVDTHKLDSHEGLQAALAKNKEMTGSDKPKPKTCVEIEFSDGSRATM